MTCCAPGAKGRLVFKDGESPITWSSDSNSHRQDFLSETVEFTSPIIESRGITG